jgi:hypothetical protein
MTRLYRNRGETEVWLQLIRNQVLEKGGWPAPGSGRFTLGEIPGNSRLGGPRGRSVLTFLKCVRCFQETVIKTHHTEIILQINVYILTIWHFNTKTDAHKGG